MHPLGLHTSMEGCQCWRVLGLLRYIQSNQFIIRHVAHRK